MEDIIHQVPSCNNGNSVEAAVSADDVINAAVCDINNALFQLKEFKAATDELEMSIGSRIALIKASAPNTWEDVVKSRCGLSRSRAFELMRIADGTKSSEQTKREKAARQAKSHKKKVVRQMADAKELAAARAQLDAVEEQHGRQVIRFEHEIAQLGDARVLRSERDQLREALDQVAELVVEVRGMLTHPVQHRRKIISKINEVERIATSAMKAATGKSTNSAMQVAA
jgi:hypothetical protein